MPKPPRYTVKAVIDAINRGYTPTGAATILGCHADTVRNYADRYPTVRAALKAKRKELVDLGEIGLRAAIVRGEGWAIAFALKTLGKDEGYVERAEIEHRGEIETKHVFRHEAVVAALEAGSDKDRLPPGPDQAGGDGPPVR